MERILRIDEQLRLINKPTLKSLDTIQLNNLDTLILCAGFEDRAVEFLKQSVSELKSPFSVMIVEYLPRNETNRLEEIINICEFNKLPYMTLVYDRENPTLGGEKICELVRNSKGRVYIDVSGMSRLLIVQVIVALFHNRKSFDNISIIYSEAKTYPPSIEEVEKELSNEESAEELARTIMFLSSGVFETCIVPELTSVAMQGQPIRLITFPSFNTQQLIALRSEIQPHYYTFINGIPLLDENKWRTEKIRMLNDIERIPRKEEIDLCTLDYIKTLDYLLDVYDRFNTLQKIMIAPIGSKMQTVAVGIFKALMDDIQIVYPTPIKFLQPEKYTIGIRQIYRLDLDTLKLNGSK
jgi:hypothetical protein